MTHADPLRLSLKLDPSIAFPLARPQRDAFGVGGGGFVKGAYGPLDWLDLQVSVGGLGFAPKNGGESAGIFALGAGLRFQLPQKRFRITPFVEADVLYARTADLSRFAFSVGAGALVAIDPPRRFWLGLHVTYLQVVQTAETGFDTTDADILMIGISSQLGFARKALPPPSPPVERPIVVAPPPPPPSSDRDHDGVPDADDKCPDKAGVASNGGCPTYKSVVVTASTIELNQKIFFSYDQGDILPKSFDVLDEVAQALRDHEDLHVRIEGHSDDQGNYQHNLDLSLLRARSVMVYLIEHGVPAERLSAIGYGPTQPLASNKTAEGRERNRRVEFVIEHAK